jgi:hypothetical protein
MKKQNILKNYVDCSLSQLPKVSVEPMCQHTSKTTRLLQYGTVQSIIHSALFAFIPDL